jgi:hypothetical protein
MSELTIKPEVLSLLVCDQIITDRATGKQSLIGLFSTIHAFRYPVTQPLLSVHVSLTGGRGKTPITIRIADSDDARPPLVEGRGMVEFKNPRAIANLALQFHGLVFPQQGEYRVQLWAHGELLREARLTLLLAKRPPRGQPPPGGPQGSAPPPDVPDPSGD